jgi:hypothetical protein
MENERSEVNSVLIKLAYASHARKRDIFEGKRGETTVKQLMEGFRPSHWRVYLPIHAFIEDGIEKWRCEWPRRDNSWLQ